MKFSDREEEELQINLTPLIDVVFLLLIFFMVSTTFSKESELRIQLPESSDRPREQRTTPVLVVEISAEGVYAVKGPDEESARQLLGTDRETLYRALSSATNKRADLVTIIRADRQTPHASVVRAMDIARRLGYTDITFATQQVMDEESGQ